MTSNFYKGSWTWGKGFLAFFLIRIYHAVLCALVLQNIGSADARSNARLADNKNGHIIAAGLGVGSEINHGSVMIGRSTHERLEE